MPEEKFRELVAKLSATEQELFPGEHDVLEITTFEKLCRFLGMDFRLQLRRNFCSGGTGFESRKVRVLPGPLSQAFLERINDVSGGKHSGLLKHDEYELGKTSVPLKERVEGLILLAEKDIRWCKGKGRRLLEKSLKVKPFSKIGEVKTVNKKKKQRKKE